MQREAQKIPSVVLMMANSASLLLAPAFDEAQQNLMLKVQSLRKQKESIISHMTNGRGSSDAQKRVQELNDEIVALSKRQPYIIENALNRSVASEVRRTWQEIAAQNGISRDVPSFVVAKLEGAKGEYYKGGNVIAVNSYYLIDFTFWDHALKGLIGHELMHWHQYIHDPKEFERSIDVIKRNPNNYTQIYTHSGLERQARLMQVITEVPEAFEGKSFSEFMVFLQDSPTFMQSQDTLTPPELKQMIVALWKHYSN